MFKKILFCFICFCAMPVFSASAEQSEYCFSSKALERLNQKYSSLTPEMQLAHGMLYKKLSDIRYSDDFDADSQLCITPSDMADICTAVWPYDADIEPKCENFVDSVVETYDFNHGCSRSSGGNGTCVSTMAPTPNSNMNVSYDNAVQLASLYADKNGIGEIICHNDIKHEDGYDLLACVTPDNQSVEFQFNEISDANSSADDMNLNVAIALGRIYSPNAECQVNQDDELANMGYETVAVCQTTPETCDTIQTALEDTADLPYYAQYVQNKGCAIGKNASNMFTIYGVPAYRYKEVHNLLLGTVQAEAGGEDSKQQRLVCSVILNRVLSPKFKQNTIDGVIKAKGQFSTYPVAVNRALSRGITQSVTDAVDQELNREKPSSPYLFFWTPQLARKRGYPCSNQYKNHCYYVKHP